MMLTWCVHVQLEGRLGAMESSLEELVELVKGMAAAGSPRASGLS